MTFYHVLVFLLSALLCLLLVPLVKKWAPAWGLVDKPSERRIHKEPVPRCGGIAIFVSMALVLGWMIVTTCKCPACVEQFAFIKRVLIGALLLFIVGLVDDRFGIKSYVKLAGQLLVVSLMIFWDITFEGLLGVELPGIVNILLTTGWFLLLINAFNLVDGMDGVCSGLGLIASLTFAIMLLVLNKGVEAMVVLALAGACLGFLRYNFHPASIFLGDCGSMLIGFFLAATSLHANANKSAFLSILLPILIMGVPIFDVFLAILRRTMRRYLNKLRGENKKFRVFEPDLDHIHHRLLQKGMTQKKAALLMYAVTLLASVFVLGSIFNDNLEIVFIVLGAFILINIVLRKVIHVESWTATQLLIEGIKRPSGLKRKAIHFIYDILVLSALSFVISRSLKLPADQLYIFMVCGGVTTGIFFALFNVYDMIWSRARPLQFGGLIFELFCAEVIAFLLLITLSDNNRYLIAYLVTCRFSIGLIFIVFGRMLPLLVRDVSSWMRRYHAGGEHHRTLIIGSGYDVAAYLRRAAYRNVSHIERKIIGLIDNDGSLQGAIVFGYPVLGAYVDADQHVSANAISEVIICDQNFTKEKLSQINKWQTQGILVKRYINTLDEVRLNLDEQKMCANS